ncbi:MAG: hypothetical protein IPN90_06240 [Elusimicrobia bacterium]|nr:hypothetical protein [Elusimicrobiota bacterium]
MNRCKFLIFPILFLSACVGIHLEVKNENVLGAGPYRRTLVVSLASTRDARQAVEKAFRDALWGTQQDPGRAVDLTDFAVGNLVSAAKLGYDSVLVITQDSMVHWKEPHPLTLAEALSPPPAPDVMTQTMVQSEGPGARRYVNGCVRLYDATTSKLVWTAHGTLAVDRNEWTARPAREAAKAIVQRLTKDGLIRRIP